MTVIKSSVLGKLKGRAGNFNFRNEKGKNIMSVRPPKVNVSQSSQAKRARKDFAAAVNISKAVNAVPELKAIWNNEKIKARNSYQKLMKINLGAVKDSRATILNRITPEGIFLVLNSVIINNNKINLDFSIPSPGNIEFPAGLFILLYLNNNESSVFLIRSDIEEPAPDGLYHKTITMEEETTDALKIDPRPIIYFAVAGAGKTGRKKYWTTTEAKQL
jgi:hypothetical protein